MLKSHDQIWPPAKQKQLPAHMSAPMKLDKNYVMPERTVTMATKQDRTQSSQPTSVWNTEVVFVISNKKEEKQTIKKNLKREEQKVTPPKKKKK